MKEFPEFAHGKYRLLESDRFDSATGLHGFLVTMARRRALDRLRRRLAYRRATDRFQAEVEASYVAEPRVDHFEPTNSDLADLLQGVIHNLPVRQQEVINLTFYEGPEPTSNRCS